MPEVIENELVDEAPTEQLGTETNKAVELNELPTDKLPTEEIKINDELDISLPIVEGESIIETILYDLTDLLKLYDKTNDSYKKNLLLNAIQSYKIANVELDKFNNLK